MVKDLVGVVAFLAVFSVVYLGFGLTASPLWVLALFLVYGLYQGLTDGTSRAFIADLVPAEQRATALGLYSMATGLCTFAASTIGGLLWQWRGAPATFFYGSALAGASALLMALARPAPAVDRA
jgi:MFS family permease